MSALLLAAVLSQADSKAELARIHEKLRSARTISTTCSTIFVDEGFGRTFTTTYEAEVRLAKGNKARVSVDIRDGASRWTYLMISDGERMWGKGGDDDRRDTWRKTASSTLYPLLANSLLGGGANSVQTHFWLALDPECDMNGVGGEFRDDGYAFKALERKGDERAVVYALGQPPRTYECKFWYDAATLTPLRGETIGVEVFDPRTRSVKTWRNVYRDFKYDADLDSAHFKIPD